MPVKPFNPNSDNVVLPDNILKKLPSPDDIAKAKKLAYEIEKKQAEIAKTKKMIDLLNNKADHLEASLDLNKSIDEKTLKYAQVIARDCKHALKDYQKTHTMLYRGISSKSNSPPAFVSFPRDDRVPRDTAEHLHAAINDLFVDAGYQSRRDNSIFCTTVRSDAGGYGDPYIIFPMDGFKFTWSHRFSDLTSDLLTSNSRSFDEILLNELGGTPNLFHIRNSIDEITSGIEGFDMSSDDKEEYFPLVLQDDLFRNKFYLALSGMLHVLGTRELPSKQNLIKLIDIMQPLLTSDWMGSAVAEIISSAEELLELTKYSSTQILELLGFENSTNFQQALRSGHEITVLGRYYAFRYRDYYDAFNEVLLGANLK